MITRNILKEFGFNLVAMPKPDIYPLQVLAKEDNETVFKIGTINDLFSQGDEVAPPAIERNKTVPEIIKGTFLIDLELNTKINLMNFWKSAFNGANFNAQINSSDKILFSYAQGKVTEVSSLIQLNAYINDAKLNRNISTFRDQLEKENIYIITSVLKSNTFELELVNNDSYKADFEISDKQKVVEISSDVQRKKEINNIISHNSETDCLVVGFKAVKLIYNKHFWSSKKADYKIKSAEGIVLRSEEDFPVVRMDTNEFLEFS